MRTLFGLGLRLVGSVLTLGASLAIWSGVAVFINDPDTLLLSAGWVACILDAAFTLSVLWVIWKAPILAVFAKGKSCINEL